MIGAKDIEQVLNITPAVSDKMSDAIELWDRMYKDDADWLHEPSIGDPIKIVSLGLPSFISSEKARMATLEMVTAITSPDKAPKDDDMKVTSETPVTTRAEFLNKMYQLYLIPNIRRQLEYGIAKGGLVIKPYIYKDNQIAFTFCQANDFFPLSFDSLGNMTEAAFTDTVTIGSSIYTRLEYHKYDVTTQTVTVINKAYKQFQSKSSDNAHKYLGVEVSLTEVPTWSKIAPQASIKNVDRLLFAYFKMPEANTVDSLSPLGVSAFSRAVNLIREADLQYSRMIWEYEGGQLAVDADVDALKTVKDSKGNLIEVPNMLQARLFRKVDLNDEQTYNVFSPNLRDANYNNGLNAIMMRIEDVCGISRGTMSDITRSEAKTATEMLIMRQRSYAANADIQKALQKTLDDVVYIMNVYCDLYSLAPAGEYAVSYTWDDSLINSPEEELARRLTLLNAGIESRINIRMWYFGETEDQAKQAIEDATEEQKKRTEAMTPPTPNGQQTQSTNTNNPEDKVPKKPTEPTNNNNNKTTGGNK